MNKALPPDQSDTSQAKPNEVIGAGGQSNIPNRLLQFGTGEHSCDPLWTPEQVAQRLNVSPDWVRDHSSRKEPRLPVIRLGGGPGRAGLLRYRASQIENFIGEMERRSARRTRSI
jgi:hypothetical protein